MGKPMRRKGNPAKNKEKHRLLKGRNYRRDLDLIYEEMQGKTLPKMPNQEAGVDMPGMGVFYCVPCAKHCVNKAAMDEHQVSKPHKRRVKLLAKEKPYDHKEAERLNK